MMKKLLIFFCLFLITQPCFAECVDQEQTTADTGNMTEGDSAGTEYRQGQSIQLTGTRTITAVEVSEGDAASGSPVGNWTLRIETADGNGRASGTLADANASIVVSPPGTNTVVKGTFASTFSLSASTTYWIVIQCDNQANGSRWFIRYNSAGGYANGARSQSVNGVWTEPGALDIYFKLYASSCVDPAAAPSRQVIVIE